MSVRQLYIIFVLTAIFVMPQQLANAQCNETTIRQANQKFDEGKIDELFQILNPCLEEFSDENQVQAYRLKAMAYIAINEIGKADEMVVALLKVNPKYQPDNIHDSPTLIALLNHHLNQKGSLFDTEVVSASKHSQKLSEAPAIMSVITANQLKEYGYSNVAEAIASLPGIDMLYDYTMYNMGIRGVNGGNRAGSRIIKLMIDNQPVSFRPGSENFLGFELMPVDVIERIEVIRGPSSALYGANAYLGVINIITKKGFGLEGGNVKLNTSIQNSNISHNQTLVIGNKIKNIDFVISGGMSHTDRSGLEIIDVPGREKYADMKAEGDDITSKEDLSRSYTIFSKINFDLKKYGQIKVDFNYQGLDNSAQFTDWGALEQQNRVALKNFYLRTKYQNTYAEKWSLNLSGTYTNGKPSDNDKLYTQVKVADYQTREVECTGLDFEASLMYKIKEKSNISIGVDFTNDDHTRQTYYRHFLNPDNPVDIILSEATGTVWSDTTFQNFGVYLQGAFAPFPEHTSVQMSSLAMTFGVRYDKHNIYGDVFNFRVANVFKPHKNIYTKLLYGTSFKAPSSTQLYTGLLVPGDLVGNPNLKPEKANTFECAVGGTIKEKFNIEFNVFQNTITDKVELQPYASNIMAVNSAEIKSLGAEASIIFSGNNFNTYINYSLQRSTITRVDMFSEQEYTLRTKIYPTSMIKGGLIFFVSKPSINFNIEGRYIGQRIASPENTFAYDPVNYLTDSENAYKLDAYFLLDLLISTRQIQLLKGKETLLSLRITNLLDQTYHYPGFNDFDIPGMHRFYKISLNQSF